MLVKVITFKPQKYEDAGRHAAGYQDAERAVHAKFLGQVGELVKTDFFEYNHVVRFIDGKTHRFHADELQKVVAN